MIPQQPNSVSSDAQEVSQAANQRNSNKASTSKGHPYVVSQEDGRSQSPSAESNKSDDTSGKSGKSKEPRILRSSRKDAKDDRGSNNSSPQLPASSTPSPATQSMDTSNCNESEIQNIQSSGISSASAPANTSSTSSSNASQTTQSQNHVELHPRKRKIKASSREPSTVSSEMKDGNSKDGQEKTDIHPHDQPFTNVYQMYVF